MLMNQDKIYEINISEVKSVKQIPVTVFDSYFKNKYNNPIVNIKKILFFIFNEGIKLTFRKFKTKLIERKIENETKIIIAHVQLQNRNYIIFTRHLSDKKLKFNKSLIFEIDDENSIERINLSSKTKMLLESFLPVESCPLDDSLIDSILKDNPFLTKVNDYSFLDKLLSLERNTLSIGFINKNKKSKKVFFIGFGSYIRDYVLPHFSEYELIAYDYKADLIKKFFKSNVFITGEWNIVRKEISKVHKPLVIIASYHSDHAKQAIEIFNINESSRIFIEKPASVEISDLCELINLRKNGAWIDFGYNRRYAFFIEKIKNDIQYLTRPLLITMIVKELKLPLTHWYFWRNQGTRITGNVCHWIDLSIFLIQSKPREITLLNSGDTISLSILCDDDSLSTIVASDSGDDLRGVVEYIRICDYKNCYDLYDLRKMIVFNHDGKVKRYFRFIRDKGHRKMYEKLKYNWLFDKEPIISNEEIYLTTKITFEASRMLTLGERNKKLTYDDCNI